MNKAQERNNSGVLAGMATFAIAAIGIGIYRRRSVVKVKLQMPTCNVSEADVYRGFEYRIERCIVGSKESFMAVLPIQTVGALAVTSDERRLFDNADAARLHLRQLIDAKLGLRLQAVFVGTPTNSNRIVGAGR